METNVNPITRPRAIPLPQTVEELEGQRERPAKPTLNAAVEALHKALWPNPDYRKLFLATFNEDSVEGSMAADDQEAARMIRNEAIKRNDTVVMGRNLVTIVKALRIVAKRYNIARKQRRISDTETVVATTETVVEAPAAAGAAAE